MPLKRDIPNNWNININIIKIQIIYDTLDKAFFIETIINLILFNLLKTFVNLMTLKILNTLKKDSCDDTFLTLSFDAVPVSSFGVAISKMAKAIIRVSK